MVYKSLDPLDKPRKSRSPKPNTKPVHCVCPLFFCSLYRRHKLYDDDEDGSSIDSILSNIRAAQSPGDASVSTQSTSSYSIQLSDIAKDALLGDLMAASNGSSGSNGGGGIHDDELSFDFAREWDDPRRDDEPAKLEFRPQKDYRLKPGQTIRVNLPKKNKKGLRSSASGDNPGSQSLHDDDDKQSSTCGAPTDVVVLKNAPLQECQSRSSHV